MLGIKARAARRRAGASGERNGGNVVITTLALERAQELLYFLPLGGESNKLTASGGGECPELGRAFTL